MKGLLFSGRFIWWEQKENKTTTTTTKEGKAEQASSQAGSQEGARARMTGAGERFSQLPCLPTFAPCEVLTFQERRWSDELVSRSVPWLEGSEGPLDWQLERGHSPKKYQVSVAKKKGQRVDAGPAKLLESPPPPNMTIVMADVSEKHRPEPCSQGARGLVRKHDLQVRKLVG